jgi:hypothetical protein
MEEFLVEMLKERKEKGSRSIVYNEQELQNIFTLYDLKQANSISADQCKEGKHSKIIDCYNNHRFVFSIALKTLANSEYHFSKATEANIPAKVDMFTFMKLCDEVLGLKPR